MKYIQRLAKKFISIICILALLMTIVTVPSFADETEYEATIRRLSKLEEYAKEYKSSNTDFLVLAYIRSAEYSGTLWDTLAGSDYSDFVTYVANKQDDTVKLRSTRYLLLPTGETTDFIHMFAVMNATQQGNQKIGGWIGDTCQLMIDFLNESGDTDTLESFAKIHFRKDGHFDNRDWIADLDGHNLYKAKINTETWAECLNRYYSAYPSEKTRVSIFVQNNLGNRLTTQSQYRTAVKDEYSGSGFIYKTELALLERQQLGTSPDSKYRNAACNCVADYMYLVMTSPELRPGELAIQDNAVYFLDNATKYNYLAASYSEEQMIETAQGVLDYDIWKCEFSDAEFDKINVFMLDDNYIPKAEEMTIEKAAL